jgi:hypothetical protein
MNQTHEARLAGLRDRVVAIDASLAALDNDYAELASQFDSGNTEALQKAAAIEQLISKLKAEKALNLAAAGKVEQLRAQQQAEAEREANRQKNAEARRLAQQVMALNERIDQRLRDLHDLFVERNGTLQVLGRTGVVDLGFANKLQTKGPITAAACAVGLHKYIDIVTVAPSSLRPLANVNTVLAGIGKQASEDQPEPSGTPRRRLQNGGP